MAERSRVPVSRSFNSARGFKSHLGRKFKGGTRPVGRSFILGARVQIPLLTKLSFLDKSDPCPESLHCANDVLPGMPVAETTLVAMAAWMRNRGVYHVLWVIPSTAPLMNNVPT